MRASIRLDLTTTSPEEAQQLLLAICRGLASDGLVSTYGFEIQTEAGMVTERCILSEGKVIA